MPTVRKDVSGSVFLKGRDGEDRLLNPRVIKEASGITIRRPTSSTKTKFKLVTVRRLTNTSVGELQEKLVAQQRRLEAIANRTGQPAPYPLVITADPNNNPQFYAVYVDEDLNGTSAPVYLFQSPSSRIKCFITANGEDKEDWSVHVAHILGTQTGISGVSINTWRLFTIDNAIAGNSNRTEYFLESTQLPECFQYNYDVDSLSYLGGGCWTGLATDPLDRIAVKGTFPGSRKSEFIATGYATSPGIDQRFPGIVNYSFTPSYTLTWCRGVLSTSYRTRTASHAVDIPELKASGVMTFRREHQYLLDLCYRPTVPYVPGDAIQVQEYSSGKATYISNTNLFTASIYQSPDYNTDVRRLVVADYEMETNIARPTVCAKTTSLPLNKLSYQDYCHIPILAASPTMSHFLSIDRGTAKGSIRHGSETKTTQGKRGFQYGESYKYWWGYGKVLEVYPIGDTGRYKIDKITGNNIRLGSMFDLGELKIDETQPNRVLTTWDALPNPQTGFFPLEVGSLTFIVRYLNPPFIGHDGVYYYDINPFAVGKVFGGAYSRSIEGIDNSSLFGAGLAGGYVSGSGDQVDQKNELLYAYSQMLGGLGGGHVSSLNIGSINIAQSDGESIIILSPNSEMKAYLAENPEYFPSGFWDDGLLKIEVLNDRRVRYTSYTEDGGIDRVWFE